MDAFKIFLSFFSFWEFNYSVFCGKDGKEPALQCRRPRFDPWFGKISGEGNGYPFQYSCLENPMDRGACGLQSTGPQSQTGVSSHACIHLSPHPLSVYMQTERDIDTDASLLGGCSGPTGRTAWRTPAAGPPAPARSSPLSQPPVPSVTEADELGVWLRL